MDIDGTICTFLICQFFFFRFIDWSLMSNSLANDIFVLSAVRTPISKFNGQMCSETPSKLGSYVLNECIYRGKILKEYVSEIILGQILTAGHGLNPARQAALLSNFPPSIPAFTVNMACISGLKSVILGFQSLRAGSGTFILAGGQENMSLSPHAVLLRRSMKFGNTSLIDTMLNDSLIDPTYNEPMGITAERIAKLYGISRLEQDEYSLRSHLLSSQAIIDHKFEAEIVPICLKNSKDSSFPNLLSIDEGPRPNSSITNFSKLQPYWLSDGSGSITPGSNFVLFFN
ncbi:hypothetical protein LOD99_11312 [Oopsacas minuta]|uniref:Thiolase N-terminal domain-containing protein n=1 Tax=Oopsacas minuta TaxID=111878 RepID=A0AAV7K4R8_9METZ|nr:hypothetical protein LOD99_11312 [Oopsacas minuta]